jgi:hypothetical protein
VSHVEFARSGMSATPILQDGEKIVVLDISPRGCAGTNPQAAGLYGMASIHLDVFDLPQDLGALIAPPIFNGMLLADITAGTDGNGERFTIDITRGGILAIGGCDSIHICAYWRSAVADAPCVAPPKHVKATVTWPTSISPKESCISDPSIAIAAPIPPALETVTAWFPIPRQAQSMLALSPNPALLPTLQVEFAQGTTSPVAYAVLDPFANGAPIVHGVEVYRFRSPSAMSVFAFFELWP